MNTAEQSKASNALGGKMARACDSCLLKRARWFCAADNAFLCQACDNLVHSANQLASRHERVRLETLSFKVKDISDCSPPAWHQGFTRKARTPRHAKAAARLPPPAPLVPEMNGDDPFVEESEEQLFCRVPVFENFIDDFDLNQDIGNMMMDYDGDLNLDDLLSNCDAEFAADVEGLLGDGAEEDYSKDLGFEVAGCRDERGRFEEILDGKTVKNEDEDDNEYKDDEVKGVIACHFDPALDMELNWEFDYASSSMNGEAGEDMKNGAAVKTGSGIDTDETQVNKRMLLRLNYEEVIAAWPSDQGCPWTDGIRPQFDLDEFMVECLEGSGEEWGGRRKNNWGREARVWRYREKKRTRLFSKKIRYEVRKLNAEKRPRMKGRFVKGTNFSSPSSSSSSLPYQQLMKNK